ncbi:MAG: DinB family protein [Aureliella sp.]|jgi:uncharacterized damage-inducible protein DinB
MAETISLVEDLYRYNDWANGRIFELCYDLSNAQLDAPRELGFGSLRNTLFHILTAEQIWLERWQVVSWRPFPTDSQGLALGEIEAQLKQVAQARQQLISAERSNRWKRIVNYQDSRRVSYSNPLDVLLLHVANHSAYHRAQALSFLKDHGRTVPVGLDYTLYKLARPTLEQPAESVAEFAKFGLQVAVAPGWNVRWDKELLERYFAYHDWGNAQVLAALEGADDAVLDRDFGMGRGSIRKTLLHLLDVDQWWWNYWHEQPKDPPKNEGLSLDQIRSLGQELSQQRSGFLAGLDQAGCDRIITSMPAGIPFRVRIGESLVHVCIHGSHHRAQLVNMLRRSERTVPAVDLIDWWRGLDSGSC